jgi:hypothetical protein
LYQEWLLADPEHVGWTVRLHMAMFGAVVTLGALAGMGLALLNPPMQSSTVLVVVAASREIQTQALIAGSDPVLILVSRSGPLSLGQLLHQVQVQVQPAGRSVLAITVKAQTAAVAEAAATAVARSYVTLVSSPGAPGGPVRAAVARPSPIATGTTTPAWVAGFAALGALAGAGLMIMWRPVLPR